MSLVCTAPYFISYFHIFREVYGQISHSVCTTEKIECKRWQEKPGINFQLKICRKTIIFLLVFLFINIQMLSFFGLDGYALYLYWVWWMDRAWCGVAYSQTTRRFTLFCKSMISICEFSRVVLVLHILVKFQCKCNMY